MDSGSACLFINEFYLTLQTDAIDGSQTKMSGYIFFFSINILSSSIFRPAKGCSKSLFESDLVFGLTI